MEDTAQQDAQPQGGKLEALACDHGRVSPVPRAQAAALRLWKLRNVRGAPGRRDQGRPRRSLARL